MGKSIPTIKSQSGKKNGVEGKGLIALSSPKETLGLKWILMNKCASNTFVCSKIFPLHEFIFSKNDVEFEGKTTLENMKGFCFTLEK